MYMKPHPNPHQAILNLEGSDNEILYLYALGKDLGISIKVDEPRTGVVIFTKLGMVRQSIQGGSDE